MALFLLMFTSCKQTMQAINSEIDKHHNQITNQL